MFIATLGTHHPFAAFPEGCTARLQEMMGRARAHKKSSGSLRGPGQEGIKAGGI